MFSPCFYSADILLVNRNINCSGLVPVTILLIAAGRQLGRDNYNKARFRARYVSPEKIIITTQLIAVIAATLTMSSTEQPRDRSFTGMAIPWITGPIASAPASR